MQRRTALVLLNGFSLSRLAFAAAFILVHEPWVRAALIVGAGATDVIDGWVARRSKLETTWGAIVDPVADRAFVVTALVTLVVEGVLSPGQLALLVIRDVGTAAGFVATLLAPALREVELKARPFGKASTVLQVVTLVTALFYRPAVWWLAGGTAVVEAVAVYDYVAAALRRRRAGRKPEDVGGA